MSESESPFDRWYAEVDRELAESDTRVSADNLGRYLWGTEADDRWRSLHAEGIPAGGAASRALDLSVGEEADIFRDWDAIADSLAELRGSEEEGR